MGRSNPGDPTTAKGDIGLLFALARRIRELEPSDRRDAARILRLLAAPEVWDDERWRDHDFSLRLMLTAAAATAKGDDV